MGFFKPLTNFLHTKLVNTCKQQMWDSLLELERVCVYLWIYERAIKQLLSLLCICSVCVCVCMCMMAAWLDSGLGISFCLTAQTDGKDFPHQEANTHQVKMHRIRTSSRRSIQQWVIVHSSSSKTRLCLWVNLGASMYWCITSSQQVGAQHLLLFSCRTPQEPQSEPLRKAAHLSSTVHVRKTCHERRHIITATHGKPPGVHPELSYVPYHLLRCHFALWSKTVIVFWHKNQTC